MTHSTETELFESILTKFIINLPREEKEDIGRLSFHINKANYYLIDHILCARPSKATFDQKRSDFLVKLKEYAAPYLKINIDILMKRMNENKPVAGAIIFNVNDTKVLVIKEGSKFGFPKGKANQYEPLEDVAAREVQEEIGIFIHQRINPRDRVEVQLYGVLATFFIVHGVSEEERIRIDKDQIDQAFWMWVSEIKKNLSQFVVRSKIAWTAYEKEFAKPKITPEEFINMYKPDLPLPAAHESPFLHFKFDMGRILEALRQ